MTMRRVRAFMVARIRRPMSSKCYDVLAEIAKEPDTAKKLEAIGVEAVGSDSATHQKALDSESAKMRDLLRVTGLIK